MNNETSADLTAFFRSVSLPFQYATPQNHRSLPAEHAIRTAKNALAQASRLATSLSLPIDGLTCYLSLNCVLTTFSPGIPIPPSLDGMVSTVYLSVSPPTQSVKDKKERDLKRVLLPLDR